MCTIILHIVPEKEKKASDVFSIRYARPERLDVYRGRIYIHPQNSIYDESQRDWVWHPLSQVELKAYKPAINSCKIFPVFF